MKVRRLVSQAMLLGLAIVIQLVEPQLPLPVMGVRLGLANIIGLIALIIYDEKSLVLINLLRVLLSALLRGTILGTGFWLSLAGTGLSSLAVIVAYRHSHLSLIGLSILSSVTHCLGQILMVCLLYGSIYLLSYLPLMWLLSLVTGFLTGYISLKVLKLLKREVPR